jgi:hypothetical protein
VGENTQTNSKNLRRRRMKLESENQEIQDGIKIVGHLWRVSKDHDGEVTIVIKVPSMYKNFAMNLPENTSFEIEFKEFLE